MYVCMYVCIYIYIYIYTYIGERAACAGGGVSWRIAWSGGGLVHGPVSPATRCATGLPGSLLRPRRPTPLRPRALCITWPRHVPVCVCVYIYRNYIYIYIYIYMSRSYIYIYAYIIYIYIYIYILNNIHMTVTCHGHVYYNIYI